MWGCNWWSIIIIRFRGCCFLHRYMDNNLCIRQIQLSSKKRQVFWIVQASQIRIIFKSLLINFIIPQLWCSLFFSTQCLQFVAILSATTSETSVWTWTSQSLWTFRRSVYRKHRLSCREVACLEVWRLYCVLRMSRLFRYVYGRYYPSNIYLSLLHAQTYCNQGFNVFFCKT